MKGPLLASICVVMVVASATAPTLSRASERSNILIMGEDAEQGTIPHNGRVFQRVLSALLNELHNKGFGVFDETAFTFDNLAQGQTKPSDLEIIDFARSVKHSAIDVIVIFSIYASAIETNYTTKIKTRVAGRLLSVSASQRLANFEVISPKAWHGPKDCPRECMMEVVAMHNRAIAQDVGLVLAEKLRNAAAEVSSMTSSAKKGNGVTLVFIGFTPEDILDIEEYQTAFLGFRSLRRPYWANRYHIFRYETDTTSARLVHNLKKMLERLDLQGCVAFSSNQYIVSKEGRHQPPLECE